MLFQPIQGFSIIYKGFNTISKGFNTISKGFNTISKVFSIVNKVVASKSILVGTRTLSTGYKVLQGTNHLCKGPKTLDVRILGSFIPMHYKRDLVASITTCGVFASPCWHQ